MGPFPAPIMDEKWHSENPIQDQKDCYQKYKKDRQGPPTTVKQVNATKKHTLQS